MSEHDRRPTHDTHDVAPGDEGAGQGARGYLLGPLLALALTGASFAVAGTGVIWTPAIPPRCSRSRWRRWASTSSSFFTSPRGRTTPNNVLALAFGVLIVLLVIGGSVWIIAHLNHAIMPMDELMQRMR